MDVFCSGMYRSGSTWQFNVVNDLVERHRQGVNLGFVAGEKYEAEFAASSSLEGPWRVLKCHEGHPSFAAALQGKRALAVYCFRDLRDVVYSLMHKFALSFDEIVEQFSAFTQVLDSDEFFRAQPGVAIQRYEEIMAHPHDCVAGLAAHLGIAISGAEIADVVERFSFSAMKEKARQQEEALRSRGVDLTNPANAVINDPKSQLHWNHLREGRVGGWKSEATPLQLVRLSGICSRWLIANGYERDNSWIQEAKQQIQAIQRQFVDECAMRERLQQQMRIFRERMKSIRADFESARLYADASASLTVPHSLEAEFAEIAAEFERTIDAVAKASLVRRASTALARQAANATKWAIQSLTAPHDEQPQQGESRRKAS
jgi:hypothetical protein